MEKSYKRIENVDKKIQSAKLPYNAWKIFFLIEEKVYSKQMSDLLDEEESIVVEALQRLESEGLIVAEEEETGEAEKEAVEEEVAEEMLSEEPEVTEEPEISEEIEAAEEIAGTETEPLPPEDLEEMKESEMLSEAEEALGEEVSEAAATVEDISDIFETEGLEPVEEETKEEIEDLGLDESLEKSEEEEKELQIDIVSEEEEKIEAETADLDVDFAQEVQSDIEDTEIEVEEEVVEAEKPEAEIEKEEGKTTILVIDDSIVIRKMVEIALEDENLKIETAVSGKEGLATIDKINPDLVILDLMLPDISGIDILKTIKASKGIPVIMLSGKDSPQMVENAKNEGADAFLPKPFNDEELVEKIKSLLG